MNNWKEQANLFANGEFEFTPIHRSDSHKIVGIMEWNTTGKHLTAPSGSQYPVEDCTLIARRIENMTEEEIREILQADGFQDEDLERTIDEGRTDIVLEFIRSSFEGALELLDRGVYPGPQSHFDLPSDDPVKVIDINEISHE